MLRGGSRLSRNRNEDVRAVTRKPSIVDSTSIRFSDNPSEKYCCPGSPVALISGSTAIDFVRTASCLTACSAPARVACATSASSRRGDSTNLSNAK